MSEKPLKIVTLQAQNVKRLKAVRITPEGNLVVLGGNNGQGKTSVLDCITMALGGKESICEQPIRNGQTRGEVNIDLGEFSVRRTFTEAGGELTIKGKDGSKIASPQQLLDRVAGALSFDPLEFSRQKPKQQLETLRALTGLDFTELDSKRTKAFEARTEINRRHKEAETILANAPSYEGAPKAETSVAELAAKMATAQEAETKFARKEEAYKQLKQRIINGKAMLATIDEDIAKLQEKRTNAEKLLAELDTESGKVKAEVEAMEFDDLDALRAQMAKLEELNGQVRANRQRSELQSAADKLKSQADELTQAIAGLDAAKEKALGDAKFPVAGLGFNEHGVTFNKVPFAQASAAEQMRVSVAMGLALNPRLRVMLIRDGSLLDANSLKLVAEMAQQADAQVWIERVGHGEEVSVVLEDGEIQGQKAPEPIAPEIPRGNKRVLA